VDDNSPDNTQSIVAGYNDPRIHYLRNPTNLGPEENWNRCLEVAQGRYYKLLPHDDLLEPDCLERQVAILEADAAQEIALVFGSRRIVSPGGRTIMTRGLGHDREGRVDGRTLVRRCIRAGTNLIGEPGNGLCRRELAVKIGAYDASYPYVIDFDYWARLLLHGDAFYMERRTSAFRVSQGSWSVAIGGKQSREFSDFADKLASESRFQISSSDRMVGAFKAKLNSVARALFYKLLFLGK
jgi:glycosyltransferase involved in cell wall biosynthesis